MRVVGIDPGVGGAIAMICDDPSQDVVHDLPTVDVLVNKKTGSVRQRVDYAALRDLIISLRPDVCVIEKVQSMTGDTPLTAFTLGESFATCQCALIEAHGSFELTRPETWKKAMMIFKHDKKASWQEAIDRLPHVKKMITGPRGGKLVDRADAVLIALNEKERLSEKKD